MVRPDAEGSSARGDQRGRKPLRRPGNDVLRRGLEDFGTAYAEPGRAGSSVLEAVELSTSYSSEFETVEHRGREGARGAATRLGLPARKNLVRLPLLGFLPLQRHRRRDPHDPGLPHPARSVLGVSRPLDGFFSLRPRGHARSAAAPGVLARAALSGGEAVVRCRTPVPLRLRCSTASNSEEYEVESSADSKALEPFRPGSTAVVPEPLSPLRSTSFPDRREGFRPRSPPLALEPSASGRTMTLRAGAPG
jgi:hypothetical protein